MAIDKAIDSARLDGALAATADAIRAKTGGTEKIPFDPDTGYADEVASIEQKTGEDRFSEFMLGTITDIVVPTGTSFIGKYVFLNQTELRSADLRNLTGEIRDYAFCKCNKLQSVIMPDEGTITLSTYAFSQCSSLERVEWYNNVKCVPITSSPTGTSGGSPYIFSSCTSLKEVIIPNLELNAKSTYCFSYCTNLELADIGGLIAAYCFNNCKKLKTIILRKQSVSTLGGSTVFTGTPFASAGGGGTVYVPDALIESYKTATNWVTLYNAGKVTFLPIEGSEYE